MHRNESQWVHALRKVCSKERLEGWHTAPVVPRAHLSRHDAGEAPRTACSATAWSKRSAHVEESKEGSLGLLKLCSVPLWAAMALLEAVLHGSRQLGWAPGAEQCHSAQLTPCRSCHLHLCVGSEPGLPAPCCRLRHCFAVHVSSGQPHLSQGTSLGLVYAGLLHSAGAASVAPVEQLHCCEGTGAAVLSWLLRLPLFASHAVFHLECEQNNHFMLKI